MHTEDPFATTGPLPQAYAWLPLGAVRPSGWIAGQMRRDLEHGFVGHLDALVPVLIDDDDIYGADRLSLQARRKDLGVLGQDAHVQFLWWNSETQSNWRDGLVRAALLLDHPEFLPKARAIVERLLATQDEDGYLGIYAPDLRYRLPGENGELWAQASALRVLLGYYEATGEARVLRAVERAVRRTMDGYPMGQSHPFALENPYAGVSHGLTFTDTLDRLAQLTGDESYAQYALWLYAEYSRSEVSEADIAYPRLRDPGQPFVGHGAHTYEHLRPLLAAAYASGSPQLQQALADYLAKLDACLTPSGGPIGDEWIAGRAADPAETAYEYCSIHELLDSYTHLLQKSGAPEWGDRAEWLIFNAGQGARHPQASAIAYLKTDTSTSMVGRLHPDDVDDPQRPQTRYKYSPAHQDVAVCCVPNAGRIYPYYVRAMWMRRPGGLLAALYGPCALCAEVAGVAVTIIEETDYPLDLDITFRVMVERPVAFDLSLRRPGWASDVACTLNGEAAGAEAAGLITVSHTWRSGDVLRLRFAADVVIDALASGAHTVRRGPLLYARPIAGDERLGRAYPGEGFVDRYIAPQAGADVAYQIDPARPQAFRAEAGALDPAQPWLSAPALVGPLAHPEGGQIADARLVPLGATALRQATFSATGGLTGPP
ncbi:glycoside hydrolase family 127 protein [Oscillochloris sp. ZM17-4]|uniref:beta-L-arabinofuranosidase domain-containing protein n=1 Tax=Oscillochloris sp. ZM17-4 TaxID=2866714 RepID=UPI001C72CA0F|nr:beta-L-arabinofuranosidase domain-containing protein [Oscillochloris sp. ZM17-4]MBX0328552.1 glycoside hydrolase family 127 protein [Oscillochloris sp. ZM17-4]